MFKVHKRQQIKALAKQKTLTMLMFDILNFVCRNKKNFCSAYFSRIFCPAKLFRHLEPFHILSNYQALLNFVFIRIETASGQRSKFTLNHNDCECRVSYIVVVSKHIHV